MTATTGATSSATSAAIAKSLGAGSGIDLSSLVTSLVEAQFATKTATLTAKSEKLTAQVSGVAKLKSGITGFATALTQLVRGGTLAPAATSSNSGIVRATALPGARLSALSATLEVRQLAATQTAVTTAAGLQRTARVGEGTLTISFGRESVAGDPASFAASGTPLTVSIGAADASLDGVARAINAAATGLTASVVTNADGTARLAVKGASGAASAFRIDVAESGGNNGGPGLSILATGAGGATQISSVARDAEVALDGVVVTRASNTISDLVPSVRLELASAMPGTSVALGTTIPVDALTQAVNDVASTFNELLAIVKEEAAVGSALYGDSSVATMTRALRELTLTPLVTNAPAGAPRTLAEIGVGTNRDGTIRVDAAMLSSAMTRFPEIVSAMFATGAGASGNGLAAALSAVASTVSNSTFGLDAASSRYAKQQSQLSLAQEKAGEEAETLRTRLTRQFAAMDSRVAAYKSTQAFLTQQVAIWTKSND